MSTADPKGVHLLDVRTFEEYLFVGHVEAAKNVPVVFPRFDPDRSLHAGSAARLLRGGPTPTSSSR